MTVRSAAFRLLIPALAAAGMITRSAAAQPPVEGPAQPLAAERIAALSATERTAWQTYLRASRAAMAADRAALAAERRRASPTSAPNGPDLSGFDERPDSWFAGDEARRLANAIASYQTPNGGWSKHINFTAGPRRPGQSYAPGESWHYVGTFDNGATTTHLRFLARVMAANGSSVHRAAYLRGVDYVLAAQFPNGCWPQVYPLEGGYHDAATFNDDAMLRILRFLGEVADGQPGFVPSATRERARHAVALGTECILASQVIVDGRRTGWGAQHDPLTLAPIGARRYEHASLSGKEGAAIFRWLMEMERPYERVQTAVRGAAAWLREQMLWGYTRQPGRPPVVTPGAGPLWARFYEVGTNRPIFSNRDGVIRYDWRELADSAWGYGWFTDEPIRALAEYDNRWSREHSGSPIAPAPARAANAIVDAAYRGMDGERRGGIRTYRSIGAALEAATPSSDTPWTIRVRDGRYREKLSVTKPNIHLMGESRRGTVLTFDAAAGQPSPGGWTYGTRGSFTLRIAAPGFRLEGMTVENAYDLPANAALAEDDPAKLRGTQAVAVMLDEGNDRAVFRDCAITGYQDTLFPNAGRSYFNGCEIVGSVDFIFGWGRALFEDCDIISRDRGSSTNNGYVTAPSTAITQPYGFVFLGGRLRKENPSMAPGSVTLGRPWHPSGKPDAIGSAVFINVWMDNHIAERGWDPMNSTDAAGRRVENQPEDARFYEFGSTGPGAAINPRRRQLTATEAAAVTAAEVFDGWIP
ncbi:pectate lyase [Longimicrobium terrae]|uniref:PelA/Pel-15E family pectate lyase n=1 Tax=Longimicrobium terrae TaxID=1639882 RepID=A0A841GP45_9BACT|nr:pectate lyase [Longimicrobium terrae]MBB4634008.1 PelA/Pel-15E family pectate lyase [Longimicrobium terrae]MBB6069102.1 PelA/Pel-15E family pectate lyase [Longimicrobium terrae]NNC28276.1 pectate lyase [Longimicrobium terrae]